jgi:hypothetical protein
VIEAEASFVEQVATPEKAPQTILVALQNGREARIGVGQTEGPQATTEAATAAPSIADNDTEETT